MVKRVMIEGMTCDHCRRHVEEALKEVPGIISVQVYLNDKYAEIETSPDVDEQKIRDAVYDVGYEVTNIK